MKEIIASIIIINLLGIIMVISLPVSREETIYIKSYLICKEVFNQNKEICKVKGKVREPFIKWGDYKDFLDIQVGSKKIRINRSLIIGEGEEK